MVLVPVEDRVDAVLAAERLDRGSIDARPRGRTVGLALPAAERVVDQHDRARRQRFVELPEAGLAEPAAREPVGVAHVDEHPARAVLHHADRRRRPEVEIVPTDALVRVDVVVPGDRQEREPVEEGTRVLELRFDRGGGEVTGADHEVHPERPDLPYAGFDARVGEVGGPTEEMEVHGAEEALVGELGRRHRPPHVEVGDVSDAHRRHVASRLPRAWYLGRMSDPRRTLEEAAEARTPIELLPRRREFVRGTLIRVERGGVVVVVTGEIPSAGTDVSAWLSFQGKAYTFEASVLRIGVPVPDRSQGGILLGFVDGWKEATRDAGSLVLEALPPRGRPVPLLAGDVRIVELGPSEWTVSAPVDFRLVFAEKGAIRLRLGSSGRAPMEVGATVGALSRGETHLLYHLHITEVEDAERYRDTVAELRALLGL